MNFQQSNRRRLANQRHGLRRLGYKIDAKSYLGEFFFSFRIIESHLTCNYMGTGYWKIRIIESSNYEISNYRANFTLVKIRIGRIRSFSSNYQKIRIIELRIIESWLYFNSANYFWISKFCNYSFFKVKRLSLSDFFRVDVLTYHSAKKSFRKKEFQFINYLLVSIVGPFLPEW